MAGFGAKHPCFAPMATESEFALPTYGSGVVIGKLVTANLTVTNSEGELWADDSRAEYLAEFGSGSLALETDSLADNIAAIMYGCNVNGGEVSYQKSDSAPYGGLGYYKVLRRGGRTYYKAYYYPKAKAVFGSDNAQTKGSSITFTVEGVTFAIDAPLFGDWLYTKTFETESGARAWVDSKLNVADWYTVKVAKSGDGTVTPAGESAFASGASVVITLSAEPDAIYDNGNDVSAQVSDNAYTISDLSADHEVVVVF